MLKLDYQTLVRNYPTEAAPIFYKSVGLSELTNDKSYENTCAIRMSLCLIRSGVHLPKITILWKKSGKRVIPKEGTYKNRVIIPDQRELSVVLSTATMLGTPKKFNDVATLNRTHKLKRLQGQALG